MYIWKYMFMNLCLYNTKYAYIIVEFHFLDKAVNISFWSYAEVWIYTETILLFWKKLGYYYNII